MVKKQSNTIWGQNILGITIKIGDVVIPRFGLNTTGLNIFGEYACGILHELKSCLHFSDMRLESTQGTNAGLGIKVMGYLMLLRVSILERCTFHQIQLELTGQRQMLLEIMPHFHELNLKGP